MTPRLRLTDVRLAAPVVNPAEGLLVYSLSAPTGGSGTGYYYWQTSSWIPVKPQDLYWSKNGNAGIDARTNFLGTTDGNDLVMRTFGNRILHLTANAKVGVLMSPDDRSGHGLQLGTNVRFGQWSLGSNQHFSIAMAPGDFSADVLARKLAYTLISGNSFMDRGELLLGGSTNFNNEWAVQNIIFFTNPTNQVPGIERMRLDRTGNLIIGGAGRTAARRLELATDDVSAPPMRLSLQTASAAATHTDGSQTKVMIVDVNGDVRTKVYEKRYSINGGGNTLPFPGGRPTVPYTLPPDATSFEQSDGNWAGNGQSNTTLVDFILPRVSDAIAAGHKIGDILAIDKLSTYNMVIGPDNTNMTSNLVLSSGHTCVFFIMGSDRWYKLN
ncbi:MAG TPA: hypothetical protein VM802_04035 [Chitinophaga sp.]|uniref:hypothetical protein n=1 Tax=Chitinophaga sp. TaxID=1869181 RepID=UPI002CFA9611|nr:hypothetical protein [Chitinophaga sp.]HVI44006.1 hypothetical protein [Chitinophaga sp.]